MSKRETTPLPEIGDEVRINIGPNPLIGPMWEQSGEVIAAWNNRKGRRRVVVKVLRSLTEEENVDDVLTDEKWIGCIFVAQTMGAHCGAPPDGWGSNEWVAMYAASPKTLEVAKAERDAE